MERENASVKRDVSMERSASRNHTSLMRLLRGYRRAGEVIETERKRRVAHLSSEASFREYHDLCRLYAHAEKEGTEELEDRQIAFLVERRRMMDKAAQG